MTAAAKEQNPDSGIGTLGKLATGLAREMFAKGINDAKEVGDVAKVVCATLNEDIDLPELGKKDEDDIKIVEDDAEMHRDALIENIYLKDSEGKDKDTEEEAGFADENHGADGEGEEEQEEQEDNEGKGGVEEAQDPEQ